MLSLRSDAPVLADFLAGVLRVFFAMACAEMDGKWKIGRRPEPWPAAGAYAAKLTFIN